MHPQDELGIVRFSLRQVQLPLSKTDNGFEKSVESSETNVV